MKKSFGKTLGLITAALVLFTACKKEETGGGGGTSSAKRLNRTEVSASEYSTYEYNGDGLLTKVTEVDNSGTSTLTLSYDGNKKLVEGVNSTGEKLRPVYAGSKFDTLRFYASGGAYGGFIKYEYANGKNTRQLLFTSVSGVPKEMQRTAFAYSGGGDITSRTSEYYDFATGQWKSGGRVEYTKFDGKVSPQSLAGLAELMQISGAAQTHNVLEEKEYNSSNVLVATTVYTYTYDGDGYPTQITETRTPAGGTSTVTTTKYTYNK